MTIAGPAASQYLELTTQAEVDAFAGRSVDHLFISGPDIVDLSALSELEFVNARLVIADNPLLETLDGLSALRYVGASLYIDSNPALVDIEAINGIVGAGYVEFRDNDLLTTISLASIESLEYLSIYREDAVHTVGPFPRLEALARGLRCHDNPSLERVVGIGVSSFRGSLWLTSCPVLTEFDFRFPPSTLLDVGLASVSLDASDLEFLRGVEVVFGTLALQNLPLDTLEFLSSLRQVAGRLSLSGLTVSSLAGLGTVDHVGGFSLESMDGLTSLSDLSSLRTIGGVGYDAVFSLKWNDGLVDLSGLTALESVELEGLHLESNANLRDASVIFQKVNRLGNEGLEIWSPAQDLSLADLDGLQSVDGPLWLLGASSIPAFAGLESAESIYLSGLRQREVTAFQNLRALSSLRVANCDSLVSFAGFEQLESVEYSISFTNNERIESLPTWESLVSVGNEVAIVDNDALRHLSFPLLREVGNESGLWNLHVRNNEVLEMITVPRVERINGALRFEYNPSLVSVELGGSLTTLTSLQVEYNDLLPDLDFAAGVRTLERNLLIRGNGILKDLGGLRGLRFIDGTAQIANNPALESVHGLEELQAVGSLVVQGNQELSDCCALAALHDVVTWPQDDRVLNGDGCNTAAEMEANCGALAAGRDTWCHVYPNPGRDLMAIEFNLPREASVDLKIYDVTGRLVRTFESETMEPGVHRFEWTGDNEAGNQVPSGVYFARIEDGGERRLARIVRLK